MLEVLAPGAMPILRRAAMVVQTIARDPVRSAGHLVRAAEAGLPALRGQPRDAPGKGSRPGWLTGALGGLGIQLPARWDVRGILSVALQVLGVTWQSFRPKLVRHLGERTVGALETTFRLVTTLVRGPRGGVAADRGAAGRRAGDGARGVREWVSRTVVGRAVMRLALLLNPAGAVIQALLTTYESVMFFRERASQILRVVESLDSLGRIASGDVGGAAAFVEGHHGPHRPPSSPSSPGSSASAASPSASATSSAASESRRPRPRPAPSEWVVPGAAARTLHRAGGRAAGSDRARPSRLARRRRRGRRLRGRLSRAVLEPLFGVIRTRYGLRELVAYERGPQWRVRAVINPTSDEPLAMSSRTPTTSAAR